MLEKMRNNSNSLIVKTLLGVLALSFVGWGIGDYVSGGVNSTAITVGDTKISIQQVASEYNKSINSLQKRFGVEVTPQMAASMNLGNKTVQTLIQDALVDQMVKDMDLRVSKNQMKDVLLSTTAFLDQDGKFNKDIYKNAIRNAGLNVEKYEENLRVDLLRSTLIDLFDSPFSDKEMVERHLSFNQERMKVKTLEISREDLIKGIQIKDDELQTYFDANQQNFNTEETRDIDVLYIDTAELAKKATVTEDEVEHIFNADQDIYIVDEQRNLSQILLSSQEDAIRVRDLLDANPEKFESIAKAESKDVFTKNKGGLMGDASRHDFAENFADVAFSIEEGSISEPIETEFGFHLVRVNKITPAHKKDFAEAKSEIEETLRAEKADEAYYSLLEQVEDRIAGGESLNSIAEETELTLKSYPNTAFSTASFPDAEHILGTAFEMESKEVSDAIDMTSGSKGVFFVQTGTITESRPLTFAEAKETVETAVLNQKVNAKVQELAKSALAARMEGQKMPQIAKNLGLNKDSIKVYEDINRNRENAPKWLTNLYMKELFVAPVGGVVDQAIPTTTGYAILELVDRQVPELTEKMDAEFMNALRQEMGQDLQHMFILSLLQDADIDVNHRLIKNTLGQAYIAQ